MVAGLERPGTANGQASRLKVNRLPASDFGRDFDDDIRIGRLTRMDHQVVGMVLFHRSFLLQGWCWFTSHPGWEA